MIKSREHTYLSTNSQNIFNDGSFYENLKQSSMFVENYGSVKTPLAISNMNQSRQSGSFEQRSMQSNNKTERSISQEYLQRTSKKNRNSISFTGSVNGTTSNFVDNHLPAVDKTGLALNHIMKQINSLKVENLELKKMMNMHVSMNLENT